MYKITKEMLLGLRDIQNTRNFYSETAVLRNIPFELLEDDVMFYINETQEDLIRDTTGGFTILIDSRINKIYVFRQDAINNEDEDEEKWNLTLKTFTLQREEVLYESL